MKQERPIPIKRKRCQIGGVEIGTKKPIKISIKETKRLNKTQI
jgi:hypothetical protein